MQRLSRMVGLRRSGWRTCGCCRPREWFCHMERLTGHPPTIHMLRLTSPLWLGSYKLCTGGGRGAGVES